MEKIENNIQQEEKPKEKKMKPIATTLEIERKRVALKDNITTYSMSKCDAIDIYRDYSNFTKDKKSYTDRPAEGYNRLLNNKFQKNVITWCERKQKEHAFSSYRFLTRIPDTSKNPDLIRKVWVNIQLVIGWKNPCIPTNKNEKPPNLKANLKQYDGTNPRPILDMDMPRPALKEMLEWCCEKYQEVILLNSDFESNKTKFAIVVNIARNYPDKLHLSGAYWNILNYKVVEQIPMIPTILIANGLKSVSFQKSPPPKWLFNIASVRKKPNHTEMEKYILAQWINDETMEYDLNHPTSCNCLSGVKDIRKKCIDVGTETCIIHHNIASLMKRYDLMTQNKQEMQRILSLKALQPLIIDLQRTGAVFG